MATKIRLYADENMPKVVMRELRSRGIDIVSAVELGRRGASDGDHLRWATADGRAVLTRDKDFLRLHGSGLSHCGIAYASQKRSVGQMISGVLRLLQSKDAASMKGQLEYL